MRLDILVVVDVELTVRVSLASCFKRNPDEVLAENSREYRVAKATILIEDFVYDVLSCC